MENDKSARGGSALGGKMLVIAIVLVAIVTGGASFYGGIQYAGAKKAGPGQLGNFRGQMAGEQAGMAGARRGAGAGGGQGGGFIGGEILSIDAQSVTVKLPTGGSKIVFFSTSTEIGKYTAGVIGDLTVGQNISITGIAGADGSVIAKSIQIWPAGQAMSGGRIDQTPITPTK